MWEFIAGTLIASWLNLLPRDQPKLSPLKPLAWEQTNIFQLPQLDQDLLAEQIIVAYLNDLNTQGAQSSRQGIWVQSDWSILGSNQGQTPLPAASLTKVATTLAALNKWGTQHQFLTDVYLLGKVEQGVLQGDLLVRGAGDPLFVWEEAIALGNALNQLGIREVQGNLLVTDQFYMNFQAQSVAAGKLLQQALDYRQWDESIKRQYDQLPPETKLPQVTFT
ncbi:MAG: D-alanyl-D-alanine carboxypeptidase, partial [Cyanobacteria bacterium J06558_2]